MVCLLFGGAAPRATGISSRWTFTRYRVNSDDTTPHSRSRCAFQALTFRFAQSARTAVSSASKLSIGTPPLTDLAKPGV